MTTRSTRRHLDRLVLGPTEYEWDPLIPDLSRSSGWMHSGIAVLADGSVVVAHPEGERLIRIRPTGDSELIPTDLTEMHCIVAARSETEEILWVADNGHRYVPDSPEYGERLAPGRVVALDLEGRILRELPEPARHGPWSPTSVAVMDPADPHSDLWVADGYGQNLLHRYHFDGTLATTVGTDPDLRFDCPHGLLVQRTGDSAEVYVADRRNRRLVVLDAEGDPIRTVGVGVLTSPSSLAWLDGHLLVTELFGAVAVFQGDEYIGHLGASGRDRTDPGWPNRFDGTATMAPELVAGTFNSPHGITTHGGDVYLTEWCIGGRVVRLRRQEAYSSRAGLLRPPGIRGRLQ